MMSKAACQHASRFLHTDGDKRRGKIKLLEQSGILEDMSPAELTMLGVSLAASMCIQDVKRAELYDAGEAVKVILEEFVRGVIDRERSKN